MPTYFDYLPEDVHDSIARHLLHTVESGHTSQYFPLEDDKYLAALLFYAKNSPAQHRSVMTAMAHCLHAHGWRGQTIVNWISTFASTLREIHLLTSTSVTLGGSLPCLPRLRKASIHANHVSLIQHTPNLQKLSVKLDDSRLISHLISCIRSIQLKFLDIWFSLLIDRRQLTRFEVMRLRDSCPAVEHLTLRGFVKLTDPVWELIAGLHVLKTVGLRPDDIQECHISHLEKMSEIELYEPRRSHLEKIRCLGGRITSISMLMFPDEEAILGLESFPNLRRLSMLPRPGAERALTGVINNLEELSLCWPRRRRQWADFPDIPRLTHSYQMHPVLHKPDSESLEMIIRSAKRLKSLKFECAVLRTEVVEKLLKITGNKLETLQIPIDWQVEHTAPRMQRILELVAKFCPHLTSLRFFEDDLDYPMPIIATCEQKRGCLRALKELIWINPRFSSVSHVRYFIECRFTDIGPNDRLMWDDVVSVTALDV